MNIVTQAEARDGVTHTLTGRGFDASEDGTGRGTPLTTANRPEGKAWPLDVVPAITSKWAKGSAGPAGDECQNLVPASGESQTIGFHATQTPVNSDDHYPTMGASAQIGVHHGTDAVRRLTPVECERLQGFPDGWTIPDDADWRDHPTPDAPRYAAVGDAVTVNVAEWIGRRLVEFGGES